MTRDAQGDVLICRIHVCMHVSWQISLLDFNTSHTSFRRRLAWSQALTALSSWWSEVILPHYAANQCRNNKTQLLKGGRVLRGEKHGHAQGHKINGLYRTFLLYLVTECLICHVQSYRTKDWYCQINPLTYVKFLLRVSLDLHTQSWRVTLVNGADSSSQFQFVVLQYNWLPFNTLWARAGRIAPSPSVIFLHTPSDTSPA